MYDIEGDGLVCDPTNANIELKAGEIIACDANRPKIEWTAVKDGDSTKLDQVIKALATRHPVTYAMEADKAFEEYDGKGVLTFAGQNPNHMQYAVDYRKNSAGDWEFLQINSWGQLWGMGGMAWVSAGSIQNATFNALIPELVQ
jgi:C1A family cysteine protease